MSPANDATPVTKPGPWPATYRIAGGWQKTAAVFCAAAICAAAAVTYFAMTGTMPILGAVVVSILMIALASAAAWALVEMLTLRLTLSSDAIETAILWRTWRL